MARIEELTPYQIADAFPEECKEYIPKAIKGFEIMLIETREINEKISSMNIDEKHKMLYRQFVDNNKISHYRKLIEKYKKTLEALKDLETKKYLDNTHKIALAKTKPIESFIVLDKQRISTNRIHGRCPFGIHEDSHPSFVIYRGTNTFHCFSCKESGDSITMFMKINNCDFNVALEFLSK